MTTFAHPIEGLKSLFTQTAKAVIVTQQNLDRQLASAFTAPAHAYSIPRTAFELRFGLDVKADGKVIIPIFRSSEGRVERHAHHLNFSLIAVPEPPTRPADSTLTAERKLIRIVQPHFLIPPQEQDKLCRRLAQALKDGKWDFAFPEHGNKPTQKMVSREADRILEAITPTDPQFGTVVLKLDTSRSSYLIVRVTKKSKKDGLFVLTTEPELEAMVYSFENDKVANIRYAPLHELALTIRNWMSGASPVQLTEAPSMPVPINRSASGLGLVALDEFTQNLTEGYISGLNYLSEQSSAETSPVLPSYYDLTGVEAELSYSVYYDEKAERLRFSFGKLRAPDGNEVEDEASIIESRVSIRASRQNKLPQIEVTLIAPEFALIGRARQTVIDALKEAESAASVARAFNENDLGTYLEFLNDQASQQGAVVLLSYKGNVPEQEFLVVWPGLFNGLRRDFVFICRLKKGRIAEDSIEPVLKLEQELDPVGFGFGVEITGKQYEPFHNVFHAVRVWRSRMDL